MNRVEDAADHRHVRWPRIAVVFIVLIGASALAWSWWRSAASRADDAVASQTALPASIPAPAFYALLFLLFAVVTAFLWTLLRLQHLASLLRDVRSQLACLDDVLEVWQWQTDKDHRLTLLRPPRSAAAADWSLTPSHGSLWEQFQAADEAALRARLDQAAPLDDVEVRREAAGGERRTCRLRGRPRSDRLGRFAGYVGTLSDIPAAAPLPAARRTATAADPTPHAAAVPAEPQLGVADVAAAAESFNYTVSHDLRAPIRIVEGFTRIIKEDYGSLLDRIGNDHLDRVLSAASRMNGMIDALLALSKLSSQPLVRQPVDLSQLAAYVSDDLRRLWPDRNVKVEIEPGLQAQGDPTLLRMLLENLLSNAFKYTGKCAEGRIWVERRGSEADTFTVRDNGAGFDMRFADRLFGVFQRLHSATEFPGTGVGLASVRRIVHRHGGEIHAEAELHRGARFHFSLPPEAG